MKPTEHPSPERAALLPAWFAFLGAGVLATFGAQLLVSADDFAALYATAGLELPYVLVHVVRHPRGLPALLLAAAALVLVGPRVRLLADRSGRAGLAWIARRAAMAAVLFVTLYAGTLAYFLPGVLEEIQKRLQQ